MSKSAAVAALRALPRRGRGALALVAVGLLVGACAHGNDLLASADGGLRDRDFEYALKRYRKLSSEECNPEGSQRLCCAGVIGEGRALMALQERQAAIKAFEHGRAECPTDVEVRRQLFLAEHATDPENNDATTQASFTVEHVLSGLGPREKITWVGVFLDGEIVGHDPIAVHPGSHDLDAELLLQAQGAAKGSQTVRLRARQPLDVPAGSVGAFTKNIRLTLTERADASLAEDRLALALELVPLVEATPAPAGARVTTIGKAGDTPARLDTDLRVTGTDPKFPADLAKHGSGWKMRTRICVGPEGQVKSIAFLDTAPAHEPRVDAIVLETVRRWRFGSYRVDGVLQGFCYDTDIDLASK